MALLSRDRKAGVKGPSIPQEIEERLKRGHDAMMKDAPKRRIAYKFWIGDHFWYVNSSNRLAVQDTTLYGGAKPPHRIRNKYNFVKMLTEAKVSAATQRVPGYEVTPATGDPMDENAAIQAAQVATYLYDKVGVRRATTKVVTNALVKREGFAMPYWDPNVGPFRHEVDLETGDVKTVGRGEIKILTLSRDEVTWEPGVDFNDSPYWAIVRAVPIDEVERIPGFFGGKLVADATTSDLSTDRPVENMVLLTHYLERPCKDYPEGRSMYFANRKQICPTDRYPAIGPGGQVEDEPVLHRLSWTVNPEGDDQGFVESLIDPQRTVNDCWNKAIEWKNRALNPQMKAPVGSFPQGFQRNDIPGYTYFYNPVGGQVPDWEQVPAIPVELRQMREDAIMHMRALAADVDVQPDARLAGKTADAAIEQAQLRWQSFLGDLAEFHSRLARHLLTLAQVNYDEPRQIELQGEYSPYTLNDFTGQMLRDQRNVRVATGSLEAQSRSAIREEVGMLVTLFPGAISPEKAIAAIHGGVGSKMLRSYENHIRRAGRMVELCRQGMDALSQLPPRFDPDVPTTDENGMPIIDPITGVPMMGDDVPGWTPRKQDNVDIWKQVFGDYMTTPSFDRLPPETQHVFEIVWRGLEHIEQQRAMAEMMQRDMSAQGQGLDNAAKPQVAPPLPDRSQTTPR